MNKPLKGEPKKHKPAVKFRFLMIIFIFTLCIGSCFAMHMLDANINDQEFINKYFADIDSSINDNVDSSNSVDDNNSTKSVNPLSQTDAKSTDYWNTCALIGDSFLSPVSENEYIPARNIFASPQITIDKVNSVSVTSDNKTDTIINILDGAGFENIYIMLGSDSISTLSSEQMITEYRTFLKSIKDKLPSVNIYVMSIPPVTEARESMQPNGVSNVEIDEYNSALLKLSNSESIYFVDINTALKGNNGKLPDAFAESDLTTLKKSTYNTIYDYILTHTSIDIQ